MAWYLVKHRDNFTSYLITIIISPGIAQRMMATVYKRLYPKVSGMSHNEIYTCNNKHSLRSNTKGYGGKPH